MNKVEQYTAFKKFLDSLDDTKLQYYWNDLILPYIKNSGISERQGFLWWELYKSKKWPTTYKLKEILKQKANWKVLGNGKSDETVRSNMKGKWTIKFSNTEKPLAEYEEIETNDSLNVSSKSKGDLDYLKENHMKYKSHFRI
jgi:hypothetical protein